MDMTEEELAEALRLHALWLDGDEAGRRAVLDGRDLSRAKLARARLSRASLRRCDLSRAELGHAELREADLSGASLAHATLEAADLTLATMRRATLECALAPAARLSGARLGRACLDGARLEEASLAGAMLGRAIMRRAWCLCLDLSGADLRRATLAGSKLWSADLTGADLREATLAGCELIGAKVEGARMAGCDLHGANVSEVAGELDATVLRRSQIVPSEGSFTAFVMARDSIARVRVSEGARRWSAGRACLCSEATVASLRRGGREVERDQSWDEPAVTYKAGATLRSRRDREGRERPVQLYLSAEEAVAACYEANRTFLPYTLEEMRVLFC